jgi:hypothetical protein
MMTIRVGARPGAIGIKCSVPRPFAAALAPLFLVLAGSTVTCSDGSSFEIDARPIALFRAPLRADSVPGGALLARARLGGHDGQVVVDTSAISSGFRARSCTPTDGPGWLYQADLSLVDAVHPLAPVRAIFRNIDLFDFCLGPVGSDQVRPMGIIGGSLLGNFSVEFVLPREGGEAPTVSFRHSLPGSDSAWEMSGYSVLRFPVGRTVTVTTPSRDRMTPVGLATVVVGACLGADGVTGRELPAACPRGGAVSAGKGVDLNLAIGTGVGPLVLGESAWARVAPAFGMNPADGVPADLFLPVSETAIKARWTAIPRLALVNDEASELGPCAELARSRRLESAQVRAAEASATPDPAMPRVCLEDCDSEGSGLTSAAYLELGGTLPVAIVSDGSRVILDLNPNLPFDGYVDGIVGTAALTGTRFEVDYLSLGRSKARVVARCEPGVERDRCFNLGRCERSVGSSASAECFGKAAVLPRCRELQAN